MLTPPRSSLATAGRQPDVRSRTTRSSILVYSQMVEFWSQPSSDPIRFLTKTDRRFRGKTFGSSKFLVENAHDRAFGRHTKARRLADRLRR